MDRRHHVHGESDSSGRPWSFVTWTWRRRAPARRSRRGTRAPRPRRARARRRATAGTRAISTRRASGGSGACRAALKLEVLDDVRDVDLARGRSRRRRAPRRAARPPGPTNGAPSRSSRSPGCSPTSIDRRARGPSPNTACVASAYSSQARHVCTALRRRGRVGLAGIGAVTSRAGDRFRPPERETPRSVDRGGGIAAIALDEPHPLAHKFRWRPEASAAAAKLRVITASYVK